MWFTKDSAIVAAVELSDRFISDKKLPDKAIDVIDEAGAKKEIAFGRQKQHCYQGGY